MNIHNVAPMDNIGFIGNTLEIAEMKLLYIDDVDPKTQVLKHTFINVHKMEAYGEDIVYKLKDERVAIIGLAPSSTNLV
jgi:hypothetical protein